MRGGRGPRAGGLGGRAGWTLADQVLSSGTNAALSVVIARSVSAAEFGAFSVAFVVFSFLIGLARATVTDPLVVRFSRQEGIALAEAGRRAGGTSLVLGAAAGVVSAGVALVLGGPVGAALLALAVVLPGLLLQDAWRQYFFAAGRPRDAAVNDGVWALCQVVLLTAVLTGGGAGISALTLAWGAGACVAAAVGVVQAGGLPRPAAWWSWLCSHSDINGRLAGSYAVNMGAVHLTMFVVGALGGLAAVGALRAAQVLLGPLQVLFPSLAAFGLPVLVQRATGGPRALLVPAALLSAVGGGVALAWVLVLLVLPRGVGVELLGDSWDLARDVLPAVGAMTVLIGLAVGATLSLKALALAGRLFQAVVVQGVAVLVLGSTGAVLDGARGAALGLAVAHLAGAGLQYVFVARAVRGRLPGGGAGWGVTGVSYVPRHARSARGDRKGGCRCSGSSAACIT